MSEEFNVEGLAEAKKGKYKSKKSSNIERDIKSPVTLEDGESKEFYENYDEIIDAMADLSRE